jgi:dipeptidyl aminopeptidase/acylaminoacyl peptidase
MAFRALGVLAALAACSTPPRRAAPVDAAAPGVDTVVGSDAVARAFAEQVQLKRLVDRVFADSLRAVAIVRKLAYAAPDGLTIPTYLFSPRDTTVARPAILFVHGGVHGDFGPAHLGQVRDLVRRGYVVVAPEYRGSTGYGPRFYGAIDYGGLEVDDVLAARGFLAQAAPWADRSRLAVMGYSHGGYIALLAAVREPAAFNAVVAHVPVADLPTRMRTHPAWYQAIFAAQPAYGGTLAENPAPYVARSPSAHARRLHTPTLVHAADNDDDVLIAENRTLRDSMRAAGKDTAGVYTYREFHAPPGGHAFGVLDTPEGRASWRETVAFLERHLARPRGVTRAGTGPAGTVPR